MRRLGFLPGLLCRKFFSQVRIDAEATERIRALAARGSVVYVMRYRSLVDYLLVAFIFLREGLPLPEFVSDVSTLLLRPLSEIVAMLRKRLKQARVFGKELRHFEDRDRCQRLVSRGRPVLIFMRSRAPGMRLLEGRRAALSRVRTGTDYLSEIVHAGWSKEREVFLVPLAVLRGWGFRRRESRLATLVYSVQEAPGEAKRLLSLLWNARETSIIVGKEVHLAQFTQRYRQESEERIVRRLARALQIFLHREERVVAGPTLLPKRVVRQIVVRGEELSAVIRRLAQERNQPESQLWRTAERYFDEMAASFHSTYFAFLEFVFNRIWPRVFQGFEYSGIEKITECAKRHPVVLVPCHRSHFDYLILSYLFHANYLSPPHIAAGINLSFWPLGPLFRGAGAYFIRRSFEGNELYKTVFRNYLTYLIREGYTQEFFIEGGRSRTGKILTPKLGMLSAIVGAFVSGVRRDLYLVPVSIHYGRIVEEEAYKRELVGAEKEKESLWALLKARTLLRQKYGTVYVTFADPISLNEALGERKERLRLGGNDPVVEEEKRRFTRKLGFRILREVNAVTVVGATSVSSTVLLSSPHAALRHAQFLAAAQTLLRLLRHQGVAITASLERNAADFKENLGFLESGGLIQRLPGEEGVIHVAPGKRIILDFYKNNSIHFFLLPAILSRALTTGRQGAALKDEVSWWLDLYRWEFALPEREAVAVELGRLLEYFRAQGAIRSGDGDVADPEHPLIRTTAGILDNFCEAYWITAQALMQLKAAGLTQRSLLEAARRRYATGLLLGDVRRPEGNSAVSIGNAISRYTEVGFITVTAGQKGRERLVRPGPQFADLSGVERRLAANLRPPRENETRVVELGGGAPYTQRRSSALRT
ncbi:MAG TPA: 1-acyl-sn-glycerol-3-phosphate acyltransferase [Candidatus Binatia bacterium]